MPLIWLWSIPAMPPPATWPWPIPAMPVIASLLEHNAESRGRAERAGLSLVWRGRDAGNPDPAAVRLVFADRHLTDDLLARAAAHP